MKSITQVAYVNKQLIYIMMISVITCCNVQKYEPNVKSQKQHGMYIPLGGVSRSKYINL